MWFATQDGLNRFDGAKFVRYMSGSPEPSHVIIGSDVYDIAMDESGNYIWCLAAYGGLSKISIQTGNVESVFPIAANPVTKGKLWFKCMSLKKNSIYIGTNEGFAIKFDLLINKLEYIANIDKPGAADQHIDKIYTDDNGRTWLMASGYGIRVMDSTLRKEIVDIPAVDLGLSTIQPFQFTAIGKLHNDLLICSSAGLVAVNVDNLSVVSNLESKYSIPPSLLKSNLHCIDISGQHILLSGSSGLYSINTSTNNIHRILFSKNDDDKKWLTLTSSILQSGQSIWIGSQYGVGWIKNIQTSFTGFFNSMNGNGIRIEHSITLCNVSDSTIAVCADDGLYFSNHLTGSITKFGILDFYYHAFKTKDGYIVASGLIKGLQLADKNGIPASLNGIFPELKTIQSDVLISSASLDDSLYFLASQNEKGIYIWNYKKKTIRILNTDSKPTGLKSNVINRLYVDSRKKLWIVGDNVVSIYDHYTNQIEHLDLSHPVKQEPLSINMDVCEAGGKFWIASYGTGIVELTPGKKINRIYSAKDGINNLGLYKIFRLNDSMIIASSNNGLSVMDIKRGKVFNYFEGDGLQSNNFEETSGCDDGKFIFLGGIRGFTKIDRSKFTIQKEVYGLYFSSVQIHQANKISETSDLFIRSVSIPSDATQVTVNFTSLNYIVPEKVIFQYRLKELNEKWSPLGTQRFLSLPGTPHGTYTLQVSSANEDGSWSDPIELKLIFLPKWYQTWWFKLLLVLAALAIAYSIYRIRINQLKKEQRIRTRLASDLHDDLGSTMNSVKVYANLALMDKQEKYLFKIKESTQEAITGIRDIIWVLDDSKDSIEHLLSRISLFASPLCEANGILYKQEIADEARDHKLGQEERRNLYMILKEAINNAIKYADAKKIEIEVSVKKDKPSIQIKDDGKGFDTAVVNEGNGLKNMQRRAKEIRYEINIQSGSSRGTTVYLKKI